MKVSRFGIWGNIDKSSFWDILPKILIWAKKNKLSLHLTKRILNHKKADKINAQIIKSREDFYKLDFIQLSSADLGRLPTFESINLPSLKSIIVGIPLTPNLVGVLGS